MWCQNFILMPVENDIQLQVTGRWQQVDFLMHHLRELSHYVFVVY